MIDWQKRDRLAEMLSIVKKSDALAKSGKFCH